MKIRLGIARNLIGFFVIRTHESGFGNRISRLPRLPIGEFELPLTNYLGAINKEKDFPKTEQKFRKGIDKLL